MGVGGICFSLPSVATQMWLHNGMFQPQSKLEERAKTQEKEEEDLPVRGGGASRLMPAIRLSMDNEESIRRTH